MIHPRATIALITTTAWQLGPCPRRETTFAEQLSRSWAALAR